MSGHPGLIAFIVFLVFGAINAYIASFKSFNPVIWFFAAGLLGLIVVSLMPSATKVLSEHGDLFQKRRRNANIAGLVIVGFAIVSIIILVNIPYWYWYK